jgi:hypothetical protein
LAFQNGEPLGFLLVNELVIRRKGKKTHKNPKRFKKILRVGAIGSGVASAKALPGFGVFSEMNSVPG